MTTCDFMLQRLGEFYLAIEYFPDNMSTPKQ